MIWIKIFKSRFSYARVVGYVLIFSLLIIGGSVLPTKLPSTTVVTTQPSQSGGRNQQTPLGGTMQPFTPEGTIQTTPTTASIAPTTATKGRPPGRNIFIWIRIWLQKNY